MFRTVSSALRDEIKYVKVGDMAPLRPLAQYLCENNDKKKYLITVADSELSEYWFKRAYSDPAVTELAIAPLPLVYFVEVDDRLAAAFSLPEAEQGSPDFISCLGDETEFDSETAERSLDELVSVYPADFCHDIIALDSFAAYKKALLELKSTRLAEEYGNFTKDNCIMSGGRAYVINAWKKRKNQPAGYDMLTYGLPEAEVPNLALNLLKKEFIAAADALVAQKTFPVICGDCDMKDQSCPTPDSSYIYNRFDWMYGRGRVITIKEWSRTLNISVDVEGRNAAVGLWLVKISAPALEALCAYIFASYPAVKRIRYRYIMHPVGRSVETNHFHIVVPKTSDELYAGLTQHARYDVRHKKRMAESELGGFKVTKMTVEETPLSLVQTYYEYKKMTYNVPYLMPPERYLASYHVSHTYQLDTASRGMEALLFSCEQGDDVYLENLTYDIEFKKYSIGQTLYDYFLNHLIDIKKHRLFLGGGHYEYKNRFSSIETIAYNGEVWRSTFDRIVIKLAGKTRSAVRRITGKQHRY